MQGAASAGTCTENTCCVTLDWGTQVRCYMEETARCVQLLQCGNSYVSGQALSHAAVSHMACRRHYMLPNTGRNQPTSCTMAC